MTDEKREKRKKSLRALLIAAAAVCAAFGVWYMAFRPVLELRYTGVDVECGSALDPWSYVKKLTHARKSDVKIGTDAVDTDTPGDYVLTYEIGKIGGGACDLTVRVRDTEAPRLVLADEPYHVTAGDTLSVSDVVKSADDATEVTLAFVLPQGDGPDDDQTMTFDEPGRTEVAVTAEDGAGNTATESLEVEVDEADSEPPVISGNTDTVCRTGETFDVMDGITASDNGDESPEVTADPAELDTSVPGVYTIVYTASDSQGNTASAERKVTVSDSVVYHDGTAMLLEWDTAGIDGQPYLVAVNRARDTVTVYGKDENGNYTVPVRAMVCSTGPRTPTGYYTTLERYRWHYLFEDCWGQYATRIVGHILFHSVPYHENDPSTLEYEEYNKLGTPASLGCIRLAVSDVKWIYDSCPTGFPCVIYDNEDFAGPLGKPTPISIDTTDEARRGWDPTDPDENNPWNAAS